MNLALIEIISQLSDIVQWMTGDDEVIYSECERVLAILNEIIAYSTIWRGEILRFACYILQIRK